MRKLQWLAWIIFLFGILILVNGSGRVTAAPDAIALTAGDIGIIGINTDDPDEFAFVLLVNVTSGTQIKFTDNGWLATNSFRTGEGTVTWTAPSDLCAGTVINTSVGTMSFSASGDQILAYEGLDSSPTFIYALNDEGAGVWQADATSSNTSALPTGLTNGTTAVALNELDNYVYTGTTSGTKAALLSAISNNANWAGSDAIRQTMPAGPFTVTDAPACGGGDTAPSVTSTTPTNGATNVLLDANLSVTFSEDVTLDSGWYDITCGSSGTHTATVSGGPSLWTLDPDSDFSLAESCTVTLDKDLVHDSDGDDPPDNMAADYVWSFTTVSTAFGSCGDNTETLISAIQGSGLTSPMVGSTRVIEGVVVGDFQTVATELSGFYVQEEDADADGFGSTSEGVFVFDNGFSTAVATGDVVRVMGTVVEFIPLGYAQPLTEIGSVIAVSVCSSGSSVTPATITLPVSSSTELEQYEGMSVVIPQELTVTETFTLGRYGELRLAASGRVFQYTHFNSPSVAGNSAYLASVALRTIVLDDANTQQNRDPILQPAVGGLTALNTVRSGYTITGLTGVLDHRFDLYRLQRNTTVTFTSTPNPRTVAPTLTGSVRVASFNTLNYFTTIDTGPDICGPLANQECRGADSAAELTRQRTKTVQAILGLDADIVGLMEMENHATDAALTDLVSSLNAIAGPGTYAKITTGAGPLGTDAIKVALIYKPGRVTPLGGYMSDGAPIFDRPPLAQTFQVNLTSEIFSVVVNHFKSKGCSGASGLDTDQGDGQGCYNNRRDQQATQLLSFISTTVIPTSGDSDVLIIGDLNSYAMEDPITTLTAGGYVNLLDLFWGATNYSYVFDGQWGNLDHALASAGFTAEATAVTPWHINADEPIALDYNMEFKSVGQQSSLYNGDPYRSSDHDPIVIGLFDYDFSDSPASYGVAWHTGGGASYLGNSWTSDLAPGPDSDDSSDDGIVRSSFPWQAGNNVSIDVTVSDDGYLACWFDWDNDGSFAAPAEQAVGQNILAGTQTVNLTVGAAFTSGGNLYARCRLYPTRLLAPEGIDLPTDQVVNGEVEDYLWQFSPTAVGLQSARVNHLQGNVLLLMVGLVALLMLTWYRRPRPQS